MAFGNILDNLVDAVTGGKRNDNEQQQQYTDPQNDGILPASEDPYGDPADDLSVNNAGYDNSGDILPASEDPLGDPADEQPQQQQRWP